MLVDRFGLLRLPRRPIPPLRLAGVGALLTGVVLIQVASMPRNSTVAASRPRRWKRARNGWRASARRVESMDTDIGL